MFASLNFMQYNYATGCIWIEKGYIKFACTSRPTSSLSFYLKIQP